MVKNVDEIGQWTSMECTGRRDSKNEIFTASRDINKYTSDAAENENSLIAHLWRFPR